MSPFELTSLGSVETAQNIAARAERVVPAYQHFLALHKCKTSGSFHMRPVVDKHSYLLAFPFEQLVGDDFEQTFTIFKSSGSSGHSFYWPQLKSAHRSSAEFLRNYLEQAFEVQHKKTLAIVGLALGSWIGGEHFSWVLKSMAVNTQYPFSVFSPGSCHDEIIEMSRRASKYADQILLVVCPSAIGHILLRAEQSGRPLPLEKMRYMVLGEAFSENLRSSLQTRAGLPETANVMFSVYGSADTGALGVESPASVALRKLLSRAHY
jgi:phenylacetate-CoA ligase